jgi:hypothetical protein
MPKDLTDLLTEIATEASNGGEPLLAHLCRMAALQSARSNLSLNWALDVSTAPSDNQPEGEAPSPADAAAKPYQVWTRKGTGSYSVMVSSAKAALAVVVELSGQGHLGIVVKDMDGNEVDLEVIKVIVDLEANPVLRLVRR